MTGQTMERRSERGEGSWGNVGMLILSLLAAISAVSAGPVFMKNFEFGDKITEASRSFSPGPEGDKKAMDFVEKAIEDLGLTEFIPDPAEACSVVSSGGIGGTRTVKCTYTRPYKLFPGMLKKYTFSPSATSPTL